MSITSHMVGAAIEANIQEAIRLEEERAHGRELRQVIDRFQSHIDSKNEEIKQLRESMETAIQVLKVNDKQLARLTEAVQHNQRCAEFWQRKYIEQHVHTRIEHAEIDALVDMRLPKIVQTAVETVASGAEQERAVWEACTAVRVRVSASRLRNENDDSGGESRADQAGKLRCIIGRTGKTA